MMYFSFKKFLVVGLVAALFLGVAGSIQAQTPLKFVISGAILSQGKTNASDSRIAAPTKRSLTVGSILKQLALDEKSAGIWNSRSFPEYARLLYVPGTGFQVINGAGSPLLNASNILTLSTASSNVFESATDRTTGAFNQTTSQLMALTYNATNAGGTANYTVYGFATLDTKGTKPNGDGYYTETQTFSLVDGTGEGVDGDGDNILLTGVTLTAKGTATLNDGTPGLNNEVPLSLATSMLSSNFTTIATLPSPPAGTNSPAPPTP